MSGGRFNLNDYVTVDERIDRFWADYPYGAIRTEMVYANNDGSSVAIRASVYKESEHPQPDATGIAQELQGGANANKSSWWENCETSAIGRALANMGMSISKQRPSREEMAKVQRYEDDDSHSAAQPARPASAPERPPQPRGDAALPDTLAEVERELAPLERQVRRDDDALSDRKYARYHALTARRKALLAAKAPESAPAPRRDAEAPTPASHVPAGKVADWATADLLAYANDERKPEVKRKAAFGHYLARIGEAYGDFGVLQACERMKALHPEDVATLRDKAREALTQPASIAG